MLKNYLCLGSCPSQLENQEIYFVQSASYTLLLSANQGKASLKMHFES